MQEENDFFSQQNTVNYQQIGASLTSCRVGLYTAIGILYFLPYFYLIIFQSIHLNAMAWAAAFGSLALFFASFLYGQKKRWISNSRRTQPLTQQITNLTAEKENLQMVVDEQKRKFEHELASWNALLEENKQRIEELSLELDRKIEELFHTKHVIADVYCENDRLNNELKKISKDSQEELNQKDVLLKEALQTIQQQRLVIEKKQKNIQQLESKIQDLKHEIRSSLHLEEPEQKQQSIQLANEDLKEEISSGEQQGSAYISKLNSYVEMAHRFNGVDHLAFSNGKSSRYLEVALNNNILDMRRFFDSFREESHAIFLYSAEEKKVLFINAAIKNLLGWSSEKFTKDFAGIIINGIEVWNNVLKQCGPLQMHQADFHFASKEGEAKQLQCYFRKMSQGPFANFYLGLLTE